MGTSIRQTSGDVTRSVGGASAPSSSWYPARTVLHAIAVASITTFCLAGGAIAAHAITKAKKPAPVTKVKPAMETALTAPVPKTMVYIPAMASDGKGFVAQFTIDEGGDLAALKPPIVAAGTYPYSVTVDPSGKYCYAAQWTSPGALDQFVIRPDGTLAANDVPQIPCGRQPYPITFTPDGKIAIVPNNAEGSISTYRVGADGKMALASTLPTGKETLGFGEGVTIFEGFAMMGQRLPANSFFQIHTGFERPTDHEIARHEPYST